MPSTYEVTAELNATVWVVEVEVGQHVAIGDTLVILESMKMEIPVTSPIAGTVASVAVDPQQAIQEGDLVATIEAT